MTSSASPDSSDTASLDATGTATTTRRAPRFRKARTAARSVMPVAMPSSIAIDDGMATGMTDLAAVRALRKRGARRVVVAVPVASSEAVSLLSGEADEVICPKVPRRLYGVGMWYADFAPAI